MIRFFKVVMLSVLKLRDPGDLIFTYPDDYHIRVQRIGKTALDRLPSVLQLEVEKLDR